MSKHYFFFTLIGVDKQFHLIRIICLLAVIIGSQIGFVQLQLTQDVHASSQQQAVVVHIPDPNLRAAIAVELGKSPNAPITVVEMTTLRELVTRDKSIQDLTGLQGATNLTQLILENNQVRDLSPIARLINLRDLRLSSNPISDLSSLRGLTNLNNLVFRNTLVSDLLPLRGLIKLTRLAFSRSNVSNLSPLAGLINLKHLDAWDNPISNLSPLTRLTKLEDVRVCCGDVSDLTPLANLKGLKYLHLTNNRILDLSPLARLTDLMELSLDGNRTISDISPLARLTGLNRLDLALNDISNLSPLAGLINLKWLRVSENNIQDISPLAGLTNLTWLGVYDNEISDISPLDKLREKITVLWHENPGFPKGGPKIEGPWLWVVLPYREPSGSRDLLSEVSEGAVTEVEIATHGAIEGEPVGDDVWTSRRLPPTGWNNVERMLGGRVEDGGSIDDAFRSSNMLYGTLSLHSPRQQDTTMYVGSHNDFQVWLNGTLIYQSLRYHASEDYTDFLPVTLQQGRNVLLVAVEANYNSHFGFETGTEYTAANPGVSYTFSKTTIHREDTFTLDIGARDFFDLAGWGFDIVFDPAILEAINVIEGDFLKMGGSTTFFQAGTINNRSGRITKINATRLSRGGASGTDTLLQVTFKAKSAGETALTLQNVEFGHPTGALLPAGPHQIRITVGGQIATGDVNRDGVVTILDLILIARQLGQRVSANSPADLNNDGAVTILDLIVAARSLGSTTAPVAPAIGPESVDAATIEAWIAQARLGDDGSLAFKQGIENLENLLASVIPEETALLANYPNPFNPETWIPYQLAESAEVTLTIYDMNGQLVRRLAVEHQAAGIYRSRSRAMYWDGRNQLGESVASGLYFYTLTAGEFTATRRLVILK